MMNAKLKIEKEILVGTLFSETLIKFVFARIRNWKHSNSAHLFNFTFSFTLCCLSQLLVVCPAQRSGPEM